MPSQHDPIWRDVPEARLTDVVTGRPAALATAFQMYRDAAREAFYLRFSCDDEGITSNFTMHDEPLYRQDVVELFIADEGRLDRYKELQTSPWDRRFSGLISYTKEGERQLDMSWEAEGWRTMSRFDKAERRMNSVWMLPFSVFSAPPVPGGSWRFNAFRIDHGANGRELTAWQPTGEANFHVPERFGYLVFSP